jgi:hypothetical protein
MPWGSGVLHGDQQGRRISRDYHFKAPRQGGRSDVARVAIARAWEGLRLFSQSPDPH